jgi:hypothetical protein
MLAFLCRRAANHSITSFDIGTLPSIITNAVTSSALTLLLWLLFTDYSPLQLPEELVQILTVGPLKQQKNSTEGV